MCWMRRRGVLKGRRCLLSVCAVGVSGHWIWLEFDLPCAKVSGRLLQPIVCQWCVRCGCLQVFIGVNVWWITIGSFFKMELAYAAGDG